MTVANTIDEIDRKILTIKHALNLTNATAKVRVGDQEMSVDGILIPDGAAQQEKDGA